MLHPDIRRTLRDKLDLPARLALDREDHCPRALIRELLAPGAGIQLTFIPAEYGGLGGGIQDVFMLSEQLARVDLGVASSVMGVFLGTDPIQVGGTDQQKRSWLGRVADQGLVAAYAVTEPSAGSDISSLGTLADPVVESGRTLAYRLTGAKQFITNGSIADFYVILAQAPGGPSFFVVESGTPGLSAGPPEKKHGIRSCDTAPVNLEDVRVPADHLIGRQEGRGLQIANLVFGRTRIMVAAFGLGCGSAALERAMRYGGTRRPGGSLLCQRKGWTHKLIVPHGVALEAARAHIEEVAALMDHGESGLEAEAAISKLMATEAGNAAAEAAIQALGGYGYMQEYEVEKQKRDVRITCIYEGTSEICQRTVGQSRWRDHLRTRGGCWRELQQEMDYIETDEPRCGAFQVAAGARMIEQIVEASRVHQLTRNQHVVFVLGWLCARLATASAFVRKAAKGRPGTSGLSPEALRGMSRIYSREVALEIASRGISLVTGSLASGSPAVPDILGRLPMESIQAAQAGNLEDMNRVVQSLYGQAR